MSIDKNIVLNKDEHKIIQHRMSSAICGICGEDFGWYCEESPVKYCVYDWEEYGEWCVYCNEPEERK